MIAYSRGSNSLAGAASLKHRMPATIGTFRTHLDIAQWLEQQPDKLSVAGSTPVIRLLCKQLGTTSDPGLAPTNPAR